MDIKDWWSKKSSDSKEDGTADSRLRSSLQGEPQ